MAAIILGFLAVDDDFSLSPPRTQSYRLQPVVVNFHSRRRSLRRSDLGSGTFVLVRKYIYGPGIDEPVAMIKVDGVTETWYFYYYDGLGSVVALSNTSGIIVEAYTYDAFGNTTVQIDGSTGNPYRYTARRYDHETGLYYYRARMYDPAIGRFLQPDPIGYADGMNMYAYCGNNATNYVDPMGLSTIRIGLESGKVIILNDPTKDEFRDTVKSLKDCSIMNIEFAGHGESEFMELEDNFLGEGLKVWAGKVVYENSKNSLAEDIASKLCKDAAIYFNGCNTASEKKRFSLGWTFGSKNNIAKTLSRELPGITVAGNRGFGIGNEFLGLQFFGWFGPETHVLGIPRRYVNGKETK